jgi:transcription elongation factor Elf1
VQMQFTCNRCTTRNVIDVNPRAYHEGSIFVQCGGCGVRHKLVDHLNVARQYSAEEDGDFVTAGSTAEDRLRAIMPERMLPKFD